MDNYLALRDNIILFNEVKLANDFFSRLVGLLRTKSLDDHQGLLLEGCTQVHTFGMKFHIDVMFLSREGEILNMERDMRPGRISQYVKKAFWVLELKSGSLKRNNLETHHRIVFEISNVE